MKTKQELINDLMVLADVKEGFMKGVDTAVELLGKDSPEIGNVIKHMFTSKGRPETFIEKVKELYNENLEQKEMAALCALYTEYPKLATKTQQLVEQAAVLGSQLGEQWAKEDDI